MFKALKKLFEDQAVEEHGAADRQVRLAAAVLLHELTRVDFTPAPEEQAAAWRVLAGMFGLDESEARALLAEGGERARHLTSYFAPVASLKRAFSLESRVHFIEQLWRVAYADGQLDPYEDHFVRKIAHLLYVPNTQCMVGRSRARAEAPHRVEKSSSAAGSSESGS